MKRIIAAALAAASLAALVPPAAAQGLGASVQTVQYGRSYDEGPRYRERRIYRDEYEAPPRRRSWEERDYGERPRRGYEPGFQRGASGFGRTCLTSRGACYIRPQPLSSRCACEIPGFGTKRGAVAN
ncbi:MAG TPA: hypothetical protein VEA41_09525 [Salinarimonas sp.]|jgi:hypothetical protein|nr:hypothetical protein [Salinarimonas sp.]